MQTLAKRWKNVRLELRQVVLFWLAKDVLSSHRRVLVRLVLPGRNALPDVTLHLVGKGEHERDDYDGTYVWLKESWNLPHGTLAPPCGQNSKYIHATRQNMHD